MQRNTDLHGLSGLTECLPKLERLCENKAIGKDKKLETAILDYLDKIPAKKRFSYLLREWGMTGFWVFSHSLWSLGRRD